MLYEQIQNLLFALGTDSHGACEMRLRADLQTWCRQIKQNIALAGLGSALNKG